jgi:hypothetical protein
MRLGLWLSRKRVRHEAITLTINERVSVNGVELSREPQGRPRLPNIPPATANVEIAGIQSFSSGVTLYALRPHMHFRGKDMTFTLRYRDDRQEVPLSVPEVTWGPQSSNEMFLPFIEVSLDGTRPAIRRFRPAQITAVPNQRGE